MNTKDIRNLMLIVLFVVYYIVSDIAHKKHVERFVDEINNAIESGKPEVGYDNIKRLSNSIWKDAFYMAILIYAILAN